MGHQRQRPISIPELHALGYQEVRCLSDGRLIGVMRFVYTAGLCVDLDNRGYGVRYCYARMIDAVAAAATWDGIGHPPGPWIKRKGLGDDLAGPGDE